MEEKVRGRCLRNNSNCIPIENIFKNQAFIINSACQSVPIEILNKIQKYTVLTCDDINSLSFINNQSNKTALQRMNQAYNLQQNYLLKKNIINRVESYSYESIIGGHHMIMPTLPSFQEEKQFRHIKSQEHQNQYNREGFLDRAIQNQMLKSSNKQEILYNVMFRNDLQSLFLQ